jgi:hypothetical protein
MSALGVFGLAACVALVVALVVVLRHRSLTAGRHSMAPNRVKVVELATVDDPEKTVISGDLFGSNVISGYQVGDENNDATVDNDRSSVARPRPYVEHWLSRQVEDTVELSQFGWFDGLQDEGKCSALAMIG